MEYAVSSSLHGKLLNLIFPTLLKASISIIVRCFNDCYVMRTNNLISFKPSKLLYFKQSDFSVLAESSARGERNADEESRGCGYFDGTAADRQLQGTANQQIVRFDFWFIVLFDLIHSHSPLYTFNPFLGSSLRKTKK